MQMADSMQIDHEQVNELLLPHSKMVPGNWHSDPRHLVTGLTGGSVDISPAFFPQAQVCLVFLSVQC
jgi:hypothetical protein